jgi:hypothetical protein
VKNKRDRDKNKEKREGNMRVITLGFFTQDP